jgi:outer membrane protein assembly factor BamB
MVQGRGLWWRIAQGFALVAAVVLVCAVGLGVFSLTAASRSDIPAEVSELPEYVDPVPAAWIALGVGALLLVLLVAARLTRWLMVTVAAALVAAVAAIYFLANVGDVLTTLGTVLPDSVRAQQLPAALTAWLLAAVGSAVGLFGLIPLPPRRRLLSLSVVLVLAFATVGSGAAVWAAVRAGDDSRFVDATHAGEVPVPAVPATLGDRVFSLKLSDGGEVDSHPDGRAIGVAAAGPGFVVLDDGTLTAYDSSGAPRWHYRRTGPGDSRVVEAKVYDDGRTVIVRSRGRMGRYEASSLVALDAMTGELLWTSGDPLRLAAFGTRGNSNLWPVDWSWPVRELVARWDDGWAAFDARTGAQLWRIPVPKPCQGEYFGSDVVEGATAMLLFTQCQSGGLLSVTASTVDPATGEVVTSVPVVTDQLPDRGRSYVEVVLTPAGDDGAVFSVRGESGEHDGYFTAAGELVDSTLKPVDVVRGAAPAAEFLAALYHDAPHIAVIGADGVQRCAAPLTARAMPQTETAVAWLADEFVLPVSAWRTPDDFVQILQSFDRQTCAPLRGIELPRGTLRGISAAAGVVLALRTAPDGTYLDGYR